MSGEGKSTKTERWWWLPGAKVGNRVLINWHEEFYWGYGNVLKLHNSVNLLKIIVLYILNGWLLWYVNYTSKVFKNKNLTEWKNIVTGNGIFILCWMCIHVFILCILYHSSYTVFLVLMDICFNIPYCLKKFFSGFFLLPDLK